MTRVELTCKRIALQLFIEQLQRGPRFTRLPPAHYWHGHTNELTPELNVGHKGVNGFGSSQHRFTVSRRKWMLDLPAEPINVPVPLRMPAKAYRYCDPSAPLKRTATAIEILNAITLAGGDVCNTQRHPTKRSPECNRDCYCILPGERDYASTPAHPGPHRCMHGYW